MKPAVHIVDHPVVQHHLTALRDKLCPSSAFRSHMHVVSRILAVEATRNLPLVTTTVVTPLTDAKGKALSTPVPVLVPILRAGLGLMAGFEEILPLAATGHIGLYRDEEQKRPVQYLVRLPDMEDRSVIVIDPMLATGHSTVKAIDILIENGADPARIIAVCLIAAPEGIAVLHEAYPSIPVYTASVDSHLNENAYIVPGLGDAGDRLFDT